jgi:hypothetical protein
LLGVGPYDKPPQFVAGRRTLLASSLAAACARTLVDAGDEWLLTRRARKIGGMGIINIIFKVKASAVLVVMCLASLSRVSASGSPLS